MSTDKSMQNLLLIGFFIFMISIAAITFIVQGCQEMALAEATPSGIITPREAMRARLGTYPRVEGKLDIIMQTQGISGDGAICTLEGQPYLVINVPPRHRVARSIQRADARLDNNWRLRGLLESADDSEASSIAMWQFLKEHKLEKSRVRVLNLAEQPGDEPIYGHVKVIGGSCLLGLIFLGLLLAGFLKYRELSRAAETPAENLNRPI